MQRVIFTIEICVAYVVVALKRYPPLGQARFIHEKDCSNFPITFQVILSNLGKASGPPVRITRMKIPFKQIAGVTKSSIPTIEESAKAIFHANNFSNSAKIFRARFGQQSSKGFTQRKIWEPGLLEEILLEVVCNQKPDYEQVYFRYTSLF